VAERTVSNYMVRPRKPGTQTWRTLKDAGHRTHFTPGQLWPDNKGVHINAHGGGVLLHEGTYYWFVEQSVADLSEQQMVEQPTGVPNHGTWTLGHIICSCQGVAAELGAEQWLPDDWESAFGYGSAPSSDLSRYLKKSEMLTILADAASRLRQAILAANGSVLRQSLVDETLPTMGHLLLQIVVANSTADCITDERNL
jgi:hypothetical protein